MTITESQILEAVSADDNTGFCLSYGAEHFQIEPDARGYRCEECGDLRVHGAEEILIMGAFTDDP